MAESGPSLIQTGSDCGSVAKPGYKWSLMTRACFLLLPFSFFGVGGFLALAVSQKIRHVISDPEVVTLPKCQLKCKKYGGVGGQGAYLAELDLWLKSWLRGFETLHRHPENPQNRKVVQFSNLQQLQFGRSVNKQNSASRQRVASRHQRRGFGQCQW